MPGTAAVAELVVRSTPGSYLWQASTRPPNYPVSHPLRPPGGPKPAK
jgi:hypothetical protein